MRINKFVASATGLSRRAADSLINEGHIRINGVLPPAGQAVNDGDVVTLDGSPLKNAPPALTILLNKPVGYVCSRDGQGSKTVYDLLPAELHHLKPVGRLDKNSSGLLLLTNDGNLAHQLTHPSFQKTKVYKVALNKVLAPADQAKIKQGVTLHDGISKLQLEQINDTDNTNWKVIMAEGRNRQIRRTFEALGYNVVKLHRSQFGDYSLNNLPLGHYIQN